MPSRHGTATRAMHSHTSCLHDYTPTDMLTTHRGVTLHHFPIKYRVSFEVLPHCFQTLKLLHPLKSSVDKTIKIPILQDSIEHHRMRIFMQFFPTHTTFAHRYIAHSYTFIERKKEALQVAHAWRHRSRMSPKVPDSFAGQAH